LTRRQVGAGRRPPWPGASRRQQPRHSPYTP
jgi:hypothetical protein